MKKHFWIIVCMALIGAGCANRGIGPQGGPKDTVPPMPLGATPENGSLHFQGNKIDVAFSEYLQLDNVGQNLVMSPPQQRPPEVKVRGKHLHIHFVDTLRDSTTYTLDFGNAVCDFTEKNPFSNYVFAFSTGSVIDSLEIRGRVYDAQTLNPLSGIFVGIHDNLHDSAFTRMPFARTARTDAQGAFCIGNMRVGTYRLYAVEDISHDYRLTSGESFAFADGTLSPEVHPHYLTDSLGHDSLIGYDYGPADLLLWMSKPEQQRLYLARAFREQQHLMKFYFSCPPDSLPSFRALRPSEWDSTASDIGWVDPMPYIYPQYSKDRDTVTLWFTDSIAIAQDSMFFELRYRRTDSLYQLEWTVDTVRAIYRAPIMSAKALKAKKRRDENRKLEIKSNASKKFEIYDTLRITCSTPLMTIEQDSMHLFERKDTVLKQVKFTLLPYDTLPMQLTLLAPLGAGKQYELQLDSAAMHDIYGAPSKSEKFTLTVKTQEEYSTLRVKITPFRADARIQVLDAKDKVLRELPAVPEGAFFQYLKPDTYYLRLYLDTNADEQWTPGSWDKHRQPETVYYFPDKLQTKSNWDFEEEWDYTLVEQTEAKPKELIQASANAKKK